MVCSTIFILNVFISCLFLADSTTIDWVHVPYVSDVHCYERLNTIEAQTLAKCAVECRAVPSCNCMGYSSTNKQCQLYSMNIADFTTGLIPQPSTSIYRTVCTNTDYTYIRHKALCYKLHRTPQNYVGATNICQAEGSELLKYNNDWIKHSNSAMQYFGGSVYYVQGMLINDTHVVTNHLSNQYVHINEVTWAIGEPNLNHTCIALDGGSSSARFRTWNCIDFLEFFCGHTIDSA